MSNTSKFNAQVGELVNVNIIDEWITNHKVSNVHAKRESIAVNSVFFGKESIQKLLDQQGAEGIRIHFGKDETGAEKLIIFPADVFGQNITLRDENGADAGLDNGIPCPPICD